MPFTEQYDVAVVGAGHAGCEAAMAAARMGLKTALITMNMDLIAQMSCNPAIGGVAKGHLVREVDALGGIMGEVADAVGIQFRLLNTSRGPAVWSPRAQCDKQLYRVKMREVLEAQPGLHNRHAEVVDLVIEETRLPEGEPENSPGCNPGLESPSELSRPVGSERNTTHRYRRVLGLKLRDGRNLLAGATIITTGTFLNGLIHLRRGALPRPAAGGGLPPRCFWERLCAAWVYGRVVSRLEPRLASTDAPSAGMHLKNNPATPSPRRSVSVPGKLFSPR